MNALQLFLFGRFRVRSGDQELAGLEGRKVQELFCFLLFHRTRRYGRDYLADLLWNGESDTRARGYLRKALWQLQAALVSKNKPAVEYHMLEADGESIKLTQTEDCWLDIDVFEQSYDSVKSVSGSDLDAEQAVLLENAQKLYQGRVLEGWDQDWCICERERFHYMYLSVMDKLLDYCEASQAYERGIDYGLRILDFDHLHERTYQKLMRLQYLAGDRTSALREYERCAEVLIDELGVSPGQQTKLLYQQIMDDRLDAGGARQSATYESTHNTNLTRILDRIQELEGVVIDLKASVQHEIDALDENHTGSRH